jgi:hypothetical protein
LRTIESSDGAIADVAARLLRAGVASTEAIGGGRNSRVYRVVTTGQPDTTGQQDFVVKCYFPRADNRNCLAREFAALDFLRSNGIRNVPAAVVADEAAGCAVYEFIEGVKVSGGELAEADLDAAAAFLCRLKEMARRPAAAAMPAAADACFSVAQTLRYLHGRLGRLQANAASGPEETEFRDFLSREFLPAMEDITARACRDGEPEAELAPADRTLSPSDFGFHNALLRGGREWVFLDFEYFGWDDPTKTVSDFLLHPGMELSEACKMRFVDGLRESFAADPGFAGRLRRVYPLYGLIWCLILLNEFLPEHLRRRQFAAVRPRTRRAVQGEQLTKARRMLARVLDEYNNFPYFN